MSTPNSTAARTQQPGAALLARYAAIFKAA